MRVSIGKIRCVRLFSLAYDAHASKWCSSAFGFHRLSLALSSSHSSPAKRVHDRRSAIDAQTSVSLGLTLSVCTRAERSHKWGKPPRLVRLYVIPEIFSPWFFYRPLAFASSLVCVQGVTRNRKTARQKNKVTPAVGARRERERRRRFIH